jgi:uncharacterized membrane protein
MFFKKLLFTLFFAFILLFVTKPLFHDGYFPIHDDIQTMRVLQMKKCLADGQIPCRWVPDMGYGYGYPQFNYYAPLPYYFMAPFSFLGFGIINSVKIGFFASFVISVIGMYILGKVLWGKAGGVLSALFYLYLPYRALNVYVRGAMGEIWAMSVLPFVFLFIYEVFDKKYKKSVLGLALALAALITSHNVTTLIFAPFAAIWAVYWYLKSRKKEGLSGVTRLVSGGFWGVALASFFFIPAWFEKNLVHVDSIVMGYFNYLAHFVGIKQLLFGSFWGYGSSELGPYDDIMLSVGVLWWSLPILSLVLFYVFNLKEKMTLLLLTALGWISIFMIHSKSTPLWLSIDTLSFVQFPWRFLAVAGFLFSLSVGGLMKLIEGDSKSIKKILLMFVCVLVLFYSGFFRPKKTLNIDDAEKFSGQNWIQQQTISIFDYLPVSAELPPTAPASKNLFAESGAINEIKYNEGSNWKTWEIEVTKENTFTTLPIIYFPNWKVFDNGREMDFEVQGKTGLIGLRLNPGNHVLEAKLFETPIRNTGNIITFFSLALIPIYLQNKRTNKL